MTDQTLNFTLFSDVIDASVAGEEVELSFAELKSFANFDDISSFVVQELTSGTLRIGSDTESATAYEAGSNDQISAGLNAYWTPVTDSAGVVDAFTVLALDGNGVLSETPVMAQVQVAAADPISVTLPDGVGTASMVENVAPQISDLDGDSLTYAEGDGEVVLDQNTGLSITDADSMDFDGGTLTVSVSAGGNTLEDVLGIDTTGLVTLSNGTAVGSTVSVDGTAVGTIASSGTGIGENLIISLNVNATSTNITELAQALTYENTNTDNPAEGDRTINVSLNDGDSVGAGSADVTVTVNGVNDKPVGLGGGGGELDTLSLDNGSYHIDHYSAQYLGQTFTALGSTLSTVEFGVDHGETSTVRVLVVEVNNVAGEITPTNILFESDELTISDGQTYSVDTSSANLTVGVEYAVIVELTSAPFDLALDAVSNSGDNQIGDPNGILFTSSASNRVDALANDWDEVTTYDLALRMDFGGGPENPQATEDGSLINGVASDFAEDVDDGLDPNSYVLTTDVAANSGTLVFNADGSFTFDPGSDFQELEDGEVQDVTFQFTVQDLAGETSDPVTVTIQVTGTNDVPVAQVDTSSATEDGMAVSGSVTANDVDDMVASYALGDDVSEGSLTFNGDGTYSFDPSTDFQDLADGETRDVTFTFTATDEHGDTSDPATVTITVTGTNDGPTAVVDTDSTRANGDVTVDVLANDTDVDTGDVFSLDSVNVQGVLGSASIVNNQLYFDPSDDFDYLGVGETAEVVIDYTMSDEDGVESSSTATITVTGDAKPELVHLSAQDPEMDYPDYPQSGSLLQFEVNATAGQTFSFDWEFESYEESDDYNDVAYLTINGVAYPLSSVFDLEMGNDGPGMQTFSVTVPADGVYDIAIGVLNYVDNETASALRIQNMTLDSDPLFEVAGSVMTPGAPVTSWMGAGEGYFAPGELLISSGSVGEDPLPEGFDTAPLASIGAVDYDTFIAGMGFDTEAMPLVMDVLANDNNAAGDLMLSLENVVVAPGEGSAIVLNDKLVYSAGSDFDHLAEGETAFVAVTYDVRNGDDVSSTGSYIIITGTDDLPMAQADTATVGEDGRKATGTVSAIDPDGDIDPSGFVLVDDVTEGTLRFYDNGFFRFTPDDDFQDLAEGQTRDVTFTYTATNTDGDVTEPATVTITVTGSNDGPVAVADTGTVAEDNTLTLDVLANDEDVDDYHMFSLDTVEVQGDLGTATIVGNQLVFDPGADFEHLGVGETATVLVDYTMSDEHGATSTATATITVTGAAMDEKVDLAAHGENPQQDNTGSVLHFNLDASAGQTLSFDWEFSTDEEEAAFNDHAYIAINGVAYTLTSVMALEGESSSGVHSFSFAIPDDGMYDISIGVLNYEDDLLASNLSLTNMMLESEMLFQVSGGGGLQTAASVDSWLGRGEGYFGADEIFISSGDYGDAPVADGFETAPIVSFGAVTYDTFIDYMDVNTENAVTVIDVLANDNNEAGSLSLTLENATVVPGAGSVAVVDNQLVFTPGSDFDHLATGETEVISVSYDVRNGDVVDSAAVEITITGTNDAPVATADSRRAPDDLDTLSDASDAFGNEASYYAQSFIATGSELNNIEFAMSTQGGSGTFRVLIIETAVVGGEREVVFESDPIVATSSGDFTHYNVDTSDLALEEGTSYAVVFDLNEFDAGSTMDELFLADTSNPDPSGRMFTLENGTSDVAADLVGPGWLVNPTTDIGLALTYATVVDEDGDPVTGQVEATDVDGTIDPNGFALVNDVNEGQLTFNADGSYSFDPMADFQDLAAGETRTVSFSFTATDNEGAVSAPAVVSIDVTGTNDAPVAQVASANAFEDGASISGSVMATDVDSDGIDPNGFALASMAYDAPPQGSLMFNPDGSYSFDPGSDFQDLAAGETQDVVFYFTATDVHGVMSDPQTLTITVTGTNDGPVAQAGAESATEGSSPIMGSVSAIDPDSMVDPDGYQLVTDVSEGTLTFNPDGTFSYDTGPFMAGLAAGETRDITFIYTARDLEGAVSAPQSVVITVTGTNIDPIATDWGDGALDEGPAISGSVYAFDVDGSLAPNSYSLVADVPEGNLTFNGDGTYSFEAGSDFNDLADGEERTVSFTYQVVDNEGAISNTASVWITVTGTNQAPVAQVSSNSAVEDGASVFGSVVAIDPDGDGLDVNGYQLVDTVTEGLLFFNNNGSYTFIPGADFQDLALGEQRQVSFTYTATDTDGAVSAPAEVVITVTGTNDLPVAHDDTASVVENASVLVDVLANDTDADTSDSLILDTVEILGEAGGSASIVGNQLQFDTDGDFGHLTLGQSEEVTVRYTVVDGAGVPIEADVTIIVNGMLDGPVLVTQLPVDVMVNSTVDADVGHTMVGSEELISDERHLVTMNNGRDEANSDDVQVLDYQSAGVNFGGDGYDQLVLAAGDSLDLSNVENIADIEAIEMSADSSLSDSVSLSDVIQMTDSDNLLVIDGDDSASVVVDVDSGLAFQGSDGDSNIYSDGLVTLEVAQVLDDTMLPL